MDLATSYPRIRVSTAHYNYIISREGLVPATSYPRIRTRVRHFDMTGYSAVTPHKRIYVEEKIFKLWLQAKFDAG